VTSFIGDHGLLAVFLLMTVAAVLPAASEVTMLYGGALASGALAGQVALFGHEFSSGFPAYLAVVVAGIAGNTLGAAGGWWIGVRGGHPLLERYGRYIHVTPARIARAERWFDRFEDVAVPLGFATPLVRSFVAIPAGILEVPFRRFVIQAVVGVTVFCAVLAGIGWAAGSSYSTVHHDFRYVELVVVLVIVVLAAVLLVRRRRSITMARRADSSR
jgi:membrane protein DedA with SNARE-associated domain